MNNQGFKPINIDPVTNDDQFKIFGLGLSRTGTTSLHLALLVLGFCAVHYPREISLKSWFRGKFDCDLMNDYDAFTDLPTCRYYKEMHAAFPNAKFIYTKRDEDSWLNSVKKHFLNPGNVQNTPIIKTLIRISVYGSVNYEEGLFRNVFRSHENSVMDYFRDYPENFLVLDIAKGDGWDKLCPFLGVDVPDLKFPHAKTPTIGPLRMVSKKDRLAKGAMIENLKRLLA